MNKSALLSSEVAKEMIVNVVKSVPYLVLTKLKFTFNRNEPFLTLFGQVIQEVLLSISCVELLLIGLDE